MVEMEKFSIRHLHKRAGTLKNGEREINMLGQYIKDQSKRAFNTYLEAREEFESYIKQAVEEAADRGLNRAHITFQGKWEDALIIQRYLKDLGCTEINLDSNYSWKYVSFNF